MDISNEKTAVEALSANVLNARFEDLDRETVEAAKNRIMDIIGCAIGSANDPGCPQLVNLAKDWGGKPESTIIASGVKGPAQIVAMVNAIMDRAFDFEAMSGEVAGKRYGQHISGTTVPASLAMGEAKHINGKELITALVVGDDVSNRIALAYDFDFFRGFDGTMTHPHFGATATAGRILGLNQLQMRNAMGIVLNLIAGSFQSIWDGAATFKLGQGAAARNGIFAAELAKAGWTGPEDALLSRYGFYALYTPGCTHPEMLTKDLGKIFYAENKFKRYPCGGPNHIPIELAFAIRRQHSIEAEDIEEVTLRVNRHSLDNYYAKPWKIRNFPHGDAVFSFQYTVSTALLRGHVEMEDFTEKSIRDLRVNALAAKMKVVELPDAKPGAIELRVRMKDGREFSQSPADATDYILGKPMSWDELVAKFMAQVDFSKMVSRKNAEKIVDLVSRLERVEDISEVMGLTASNFNPK